MLSIDINKVLNVLEYDPKDPLLFNSGFFIWFFVIFISLYSIIAKYRNARIYTFVIFSLYFIYKACGYYMVLILLSAIVDFILSNIIYKSKKTFRKKFYLIISIVSNLGLLFYFKYTNFFIESVNQLSHSNFNYLNLILPIGISFYTFENLSYTVDVYKGHFKPVKKFIDYLYFLSFFPKLMMGPIVRAADFLPQLDKPFIVSKNTFAEGFYLIFSGLFKKIVISDYINVNLVGYIFEDPSKHTGLECLFGVYGYALVIYCDFSGYSSMAIGIAKWSGINIPPNFLSPYQSSSITEFWRRWHISLSSWLRDYLYIPLGGNRKGKFRSYFNLLITMLLGGFWHGASVNFIIWGGLHGLALGIDKVRNYIFKPFPKISNSIILKILGVFVTFHFVCFCWIFFKSSTLIDSKAMLHQIFGNFKLDIFIEFYSNYYKVIWIMFIGFVLHFTPISLEERLINLSARLPISIFIIFAVILIYIFVHFKTAEPVMPVYLQF